MRLVLVVIIAYLIGSIPFGYLIVRATGGGDVRETGSGGTGATNVSRRAGKAAGIFTLLLDAAKGALAVVVAKSIFNGDSTGWLTAAAAIAVILGHIFPVWLRFHGGDGRRCVFGAGAGGSSCRSGDLRCCCRAHEVCLAGIDTRGVDDSAVCLVARSAGDLSHTVVNVLSCGSVVDCVCAPRKHQTIIARY